MSCRYSDSDGKCELWDDNVEQNGNDDKGFCLCEDDPDPTIMCEDYQG